MLKLFRLARLRLRIAAYPLIAIILSLAGWLYGALQQADWVLSKWPQGRAMPRVEVLMLVGGITWLTLIVFWPELDKAEQPDVALVWDWTDDRKKLLDRSDVPKQMLVHNRGGEWIYNVQIYPVKLADEMTFESINEVGPGEQHLALARWSGRTSVTSSYDYFFCAKVNEDVALEKKWHYTKLHQRGISPTFLKIPMRVTYEGSSHRAWESKWDFIYDVGGDSLFERTSRRRI